MLDLCPNAIADAQARAAAAPAADILPPTLIDQAIAQFGEAAVILMLVLAGLVVAAPLARIGWRALIRLKASLTAPWQRFAYLLLIGSMIAVTGAVAAGITATVIAGRPISRFPDIFIDKRLLVALRPGLLLIRDVFWCALATWTITLVALLLRQQATRVVEWVRTGQ